jgi:hypothetical protein
MALARVNRKAVPWTANVFGEEGGLCDVLE